MSETIDFLQPGMITGIGLGHVCVELCVLAVTVAPTKHLDLAMNTVLAMN